MRDINNQRDNCSPTAIHHRIMTEEAPNPQRSEENTNSPPRRNLEERRTQWVHLLRHQNYEPVIRDILHDELPKYTNSRVIDPTNLVSHMRECALILASAPKVFFAAVEGNLVSRMRHDAELQSEHAELLQRAQHQPSIYVHLLADERGHAPTPVQYLLIRDAIEAYIDTSSTSTRATAQTHANAIDRIAHPPVSPAASERGHRKYLSTPRCPRSPHRASALHRLITGITDRCSLAPTLQHLQHLPLPYPPAEVGYSLHAPLRLAQHRAHRSSNTVMNLVEDVCTYLYRTHSLPQQFTLHQFVVFLCWRREQVRIAEVFVSGVLQSWVEAGGMNAWPAGRSVESARQVGKEGLGGGGGGEGVGEGREEWRGGGGRWVEALEWEGQGKGEEEDELVL